MENTILSLKGSLNVIINHDAKTIIFEEYGAHVLTVTADELTDISTAWITGTI